MSRRRVEFNLPKKQFSHELFSRVIYDPHKIYFVRSDKGFTLNHLASNLDIVEQYID